MTGDARTRAEPPVRRDARDLLVAGLARLPLRLAAALAAAVAWTWWFLVPIRRRDARDALVRALPDAPPRATLVRMFRDIALGYVEILRYDRVRFTTSGVEDIPRGSLLLGGHGGSWDVALLGWADRVPLAIFLRTPTDPWARRLLAGLRARHDVLALETGARMDDAYAALAAGRSVFFVQDQRHAKGLWSPFFGRPARTSAGIAAAHLKTGRPIWLTWQHRVGLAHHHLRAEPLAPPPLTGDRAADVQAITDACNAWYEARIREYPHGWLWLHRRWR